MNFNYINSRKIKKISKCKLFVASYLLCGTLSLSGCAINNFNNKMNNDKQSISIENQVELQEEKYNVQFIFENLDYLKDDEKDLIGIYDKFGNIYAGYYIYNIEENHKIGLPTRNFIIDSKMLGEVEVHVEEGEEVFVYVDYLNRTLDVEKGMGVNNKVR